MGVLLVLLLTSGSLIFSCFKMKVMGLLILALACSVMNTTAAPAPAPFSLPGIIVSAPAAAATAATAATSASVAFSTIGGLVFTNAAGIATLTIPTSTLFLGKAVALKGAVLAALAANSQQ